MTNGVHKATVSQEELAKMKEDPSVQVINSKEGKVTGEACGVEWVISSNSTSANSSVATQTDFNKVIEEFEVYTSEILKSKGEEYASDDDRLENFRTVGNMLDMKPEEVCVTYLLKHTQRLGKAVREDDYEWDWRQEDGSEALKQRVADAINYLYLLALALEKREDGS